MIPSWCQLEDRVTSYSLPDERTRLGRANTSVYKVKHDFKGKISDSNCVEISAEAIEMD